MRRAVGAIVLFLLVGAAVNVAVAWGCALWSPVGAKRSGRLAPTLDGLLPADWMPPGSKGTARLDSCGSSGPGVRLHDVMVLAGPEDGDLYQRVRFLRILRAGWPLPTLGCYATANLASGAEPPVLHGGVRPPAWFPARDTGRMGVSLPMLRALPLTPVWRGFLLNALAYGAGCGVIVAIPRLVRAATRRRAGLCGACGYPVLGLERCPECGRKIDGVDGGGRGTQVAGRARVAGGVAAPVVMESPSARGEEAGRDGSGTRTTPEGVAYERASPLKRAGERGGVLP